MGDTLRSCAGFRCDPQGLTPCGVAPNLYIKQAKKAAETVAKKYGLSFVALFGSQATGRVHEKSDVDIGVAKRVASYFEEVSVPLVGIKNELTRTLNRDDIKVVNLSTVSSTFMRVVVEEGTVLYEANRNEFLEWKLFAMTVWRETAWFRNLKKWLEMGNKLSPSWSRSDFMFD